ncbi:MAG: glycosyl transferase family protein [Candidatus Taylorbacteria bacterium]|nr:glycosyl transferase family protein [Candidatus Taylorbacteria bacterium]
MQNKKKIILVITKSSWGGAQRYVFDLATSLQKEGFEIIVATGGQKALYHKLKAEGVKVIEIPGMERDLSLPKEIKAFGFLYKLFKKEKPDIIHLNSSKAGLGALAGRLTGIKKIVFTMHGLATNENRPPYQKRFIRLIYILTIILCHKTIAVSDALKKQSERELGMVSHKITVIRNGIMSPDFLTKHDARHLLIQSMIKGKADIKLASFTIGTIGELHPIKGHSYLLEGFQTILRHSALPLYLFIIGDGQDNKKIQKQIDTMKLSDNVFMCGHVDNAETILKAFDIFILPSISEGLPYVLEEAGFAGLPTIASNVGGIPEIIEDKKTGLLIKPQSASDIAHAIQKLVYEPELRKDIGLNLHKKVTTEFILEKMVLDTKKIYGII